MVSNVHYYSTGSFVALCYVCICLFFSHWKMSTLWVPVCQDVICVTWLSISSLGSSVAFVRGACLEASQRANFSSDWHLRVFLCSRLWHLDIYVLSRRWRVCCSSCSSPCFLPWCIIMDHFFISVLRLRLMFFIRFPSPIFIFLHVISSNSVLYFVYWSLLVSFETSNSFLSSTSSWFWSSCFFLQTTSESSFPSRSSQPIALTENMFFIKKIVHWCGPASVPKWGYFFEEFS